ncbi:MAG: hypothetical protein IKV54_01775 [Clostridia bacterium]|nr:hypothetical protein [Clostridia bacterium]
MAKRVPINKTFLMLLGGILLLCVALTVASIVYIAIICGDDSFEESAGDQLPADSLLNCYYYNVLPAAEQELYLTVLPAVESYAPVTEAVEREYTPEEYESVMLALTADHPELFYLDTDGSALETARGKSRVVLSYLGSAEEIAAMREELSQAVGDIIERVKAAVSEDPDSEAELTSIGEFELELLLHDLFCDSVTYFERPAIDYGDDTVIPEETAPLEAPAENEYTDIERRLASTAYGALVRGRAFSGGYAMGMKYLLNSAGLVCDVVRGTADGSPHMWNIVYVDGKFYHLDSAYNDGDIEFAPELKFHGYFNLSAESVKMDHTIDKEELLPVAQQEQDYYRVKGLRAENLMELDRIAYREVLNAVYSGRNYIELYPTFAREGDSFKADLLNVISRVNKNQDERELKVVFRVYNASATNNALTVQLFYEAE